MTYLDAVKHYHTAIWDEKNSNAIDTFFHPNATIHSPLKTTKGTDALKVVLSNWQNAFPSLSVSWDSFVVEGNKVVSQWSATGKHEGEFMGCSPSHNTISYSGVSIYRFDGAKVIEYWAYVDMNHVKAQLVPLDA